MTVAVGPPHCKPDPVPVAVMYCPADPVIPLIVIPAAPSPGVTENGKVPAFTFDKFKFETPEALPTKFAVKRPYTTLSDDVMFAVKIFVLNKFAFEDTLMFE